VNSEYWYFDRFGGATDVMQRGASALRSPGPAEATVAIRAVGLNQAENRYLRGTHFPPSSFPACIGHEAVGEIIALGRDIAVDSNHFRVGDRVALLPMCVDTPRMGALRTVGIYDYSALVPVPEEYTDAEGASYWMGVFTMAGAMFAAGLGPSTTRGKRVLFTAATGGMGVVGLKLARAWGGVAIATTRNPTKAQQIAGCADEVAIVRSARDLKDAIGERFPDGVDVVIDPLGGDFVGAAIDVCAAGGRYVGYESVADARGSFDIMTLLAKDVSIRGHTIFQLLSMPERIQSLIEAGMTHARSATPIVSASFVFADAPIAFDALERGDHVGKVVVTL